MKLNPIAFIQIALSWAVLTYFIAVLFGVYMRLGTLVRQRPRKRLRLRAGMAHITMMAPSMAVGVSYPTWEKMCEDISNSRILEFAGMPGPPWNTESTNPTALDVFTYSDEGSLGAIYMWWCLAALVLNRNRDLSKPEPGEIPQPQEQA